MTWRSTGAVFGAMFVVGLLAWTFVPFGPQPAFEGAGYTAVRAAFAMIVVLVIVLFPLVVVHAIRTRNRPYDDRASYLFGSAYDVDMDHGGD